MTHVTISIDAMGGDHGIDSTVPASVQAVIDDKQLSIILVGDESTIKTALDSTGYTGQKISVHHASEVVEMDEPPAHALKKKKNSSMRVAINLVKDGKASAAVSAGNTGALMATARFVLKMLKGIERPAICTEIPTEKGSVHMLDLGANVDSSPEMLLQFANMGSEVCKVVKSIENPRIRLLNVGSEEIKGSAKVKQASELIQSSSLNYLGYVEGDEIFSDKTDVVVCDGFEGNIALKTSEGVASLIAKIAKEEFTSSILSKCAAFLSMFVFKRVKRRLDPRQYNGATLVGLRGVVVKSHGGTDAIGFCAAIKVAAKEAKLQLPERIDSAIQELQLTTQN